MKVFSEEAEELIGGYFDKIGTAYLNMMDGGAYFRIGYEKYYLNDDAHVAELARRFLYRYFCESPCRRRLPENLKGALQLVLTRKAKDNVRDPLAEMTSSVKWDGVLP